MTSLKRMAEQAYFDSNGKLHYSPKENAGENEKQNSTGERGERGENPHEYTKDDGRKMGEKGRNSPHEPYENPVYPVDALGDLQNVCEYMRDEMQLPVETAGQSLLAAASLLTQGLYDVETLAGIKPLSINCMTFSESGDGKSTAESVALKPIADADFNGHENHEAAMSEWLGRSKKDRESGDQPVAPYRLLKSGTMPGIIRSFREGVSSQGSFTAEAASMLSGWGMSAEQKKDTMAGLNSLWDGSSISIVRQGEGRVQLYNKRFCCHWMIQPDAARESLNDELFKTIGLWPRFLVAWPAPMIPRQYRRFAPEEDGRVTNYWSSCKVLLTERYLIPENERRVIRLSDNGRDILIKFWEKMDTSRDPASKINQLKPFCVRGAEQVCRIAGVLSAFKNHSQGKTDFLISETDVKNAVRLFMYSLDVWSGIFGRREDMEHQSWANALHAWIAKQPDGRATETSMLKLATPKTLRSKHKRDVALSILKAEGRIARVAEVLPNGAQRMTNDEWGVC